jgi:peptide/nickel transport system permease protein
MMIPILLGIIVIVFSLMYIMPGDPARSILGESATQEALKQVREELKLDDPYMVRLGDYILGLLHGDFGTSFKTKRPVLEEIMSRYPTTLKLTFGSVIFGLVVGILFGIISAVRQYTALDRICTTISLFGVSAPSFWVAMILVLIFSVNLKWLPATGTVGIVSWILPVFTMGLNASALIMRMTRSSMLEVIRQDYIRTAKAKGQRELKIITHHALRNAMVPIVTVIGIQICVLLAGAVLVESVFALPGIGKYVIDSIGFKDFPAVQGVVLWIGLNCAIINLLVDITYAFIDPRIKSMYKNTNPFKFLKPKRLGGKADA